MEGMYSIMEMTALVYRFGAALIIGFLVGLQREYAEDDPHKEMFAGARTFALMSLVGCGAALAADILDSPGVFIGIFLLSHPGWLQLSEPAPSLLNFRGFVFYRFNFML